MTSDVKRYDPLAGLARNAKLRRMEMQCDPQWVLDLLAERDALKKDAERYRFLCDPEDADEDYLAHAVNTLNAWADKTEIDQAIDAALKGEQP